MRISLTCFLLFIASLLVGCFLDTSPRSVDVTEPPVIIHYEVDSSLAVPVLDGGIVMATGDLLLAWFELKYARRYDLEEYRASLGARIVYSGTELVYRDSLHKTGTTIRYRLRAFDGRSYSQWSPSREFLY
jgi:hypothetical protein